MVLEVIALSYGSSVLRATMKRIVDEPKYEYNARIPTQ
jgi:hypothetical protein